MTSLQWYSTRGSRFPGVASVRGGMEAVEHDDLVAGGDELVDDVRADEPGPAGHQNPHHTDLPRESQREAGAAVGVDNGEVAAVRLDEALGNRQPESRTCSRSASAV